MGDVSINIKSVERVVGLQIQHNTREVLLTVESKDTRNVSLNVSQPSAAKHYAPDPLTQAPTLTFNRFEKILGDGFEFDIGFQEIGFSFGSVNFYKPTGENVSVAYRKADKIYISSNINLLNHKVIFN